MYRLISGFIFGAAVLTALPAAAQSEPPLSYEWAENASAEAAGQRLLGPLAALYPNYGGFSHSHFGPSWGVAFASRARSAGMHGLCEADITWLSFGPLPPVADAEPSDSDDALTESEEDALEPTPSVLRRIDTEIRYRAIADTAPQPWTEAYEAEMEAACAGQTDGWEFGIADDGPDAWFTIRLQVILSDMASNEPDALLGLLESCVGAECSEPLALVARLRDARFWSTDMQPCDPLIDIYGGPRFDGPYCLKARYLLSRTGNESEAISVSARLEMRYSADRMVTLDPHLLGIRLKRESIIED